MTYWIFYNRYDLLSFFHSRYDLLGADVERPKFPKASLLTRKCEIKANNGDHNSWSPHPFCILFSFGIDGWCTAHSNWYLIFCILPKWRDDELLSGVDLSTLLWCSDTKHCVIASVAAKVVFSPSGSLRPLDYGCYLRNGKRKSMFAVNVAIYVWLSQLSQWRVKISHIRHQVNVVNK